MACPTDRQTKSSPPSREGDADGHQRQRVSLRTKVCELSRLLIRRPRAAGDNTVRRCPLRISRCRVDDRRRRRLLAVASAPDARSGALDRAVASPRCAISALITTASTPFRPRGNGPYRVPHIAHQAQRGGVPPNAGTAHTVRTSGCPLQSLPTSERRAYSPSTESRCR